VTDRLASMARRVGGGCRKTVAGVALCSARKGGAR
jgi:hypothetical protein